MVWCSWLGSVSPPHPPHLKYPGVWLSFTEMEIEPSNLDAVYCRWPKILLHWETAPVQIRQRNYRSLTRSWIRWECAVWGLLGNQALYPFLPTFETSAYQFVGSRLRRLMSFVLVFFALFLLECLFLSLEKIIVNKISRSILVWELLSSTILLDWWPGSKF